MISLLPSATEMVYALGRGADLVGRSEECDFPSEVRRLPPVMRARWHDSDRPSSEIDARVRASLRSGESLYLLDLERLAELRPDLILTQDLCRVCSVTDAEVVDGCRAAGVDPRIVSLSPTRLAGVWESLETLGEALGEGTRAAEMADGLRRRTRPAAPTGTSPAPTVAVVEWVDPPILSGLWTPDLIRAAGAREIGPAPGDSARGTTWAELAAQRPDLVVVSPCSFALERTRREIAATPTVVDGLDRLARTGRVVLADEAYFSRPGPRLAESVGLVRALLAGEVPTSALPFENWPGRSEAVRP